MRKFIVLFVKLVLSGSFLFLQGAAENFDILHIRKVFNEIEKTFRLLKKLSGGRSVP